MADNKPTAREWMVKRHMEIVHLTEKVNHLEEKVRNLSGKMNDCAVKCAGFESEMRAKAGVWSLIGGAIPACVIIAYILLKGN